MNSLEEVMCELLREDVNDQGLPPGFRFHPTDEELITYYLASKVFNGGLRGVEFVVVDLNRCEPWELADVAKLGEKEWYFFSLRDRKYPTGLRTNRATGAGYWKATGKDKEVHRAITGSLVGMKKTLVFYKGRAPRGEKTKWVLHEYRLDGELSCRHTSKEEWVICRIFNKAGGDNKNSYCPHPSYFPDTPSYTISLNPSMPPFLDFQTLETQNLHPHPYFHQDLYHPLFPLPLPPSFPPTPTNPIDSLLKPHCPSSQDDSITNWLESYLQSPLVSDMGLGSLGLPPFGGGTINHDMPMMPHIAAPPSGPLDP